MVPDGPRTDVRTSGTRCAASADVHLFAGDRIDDAIVRRMRGLRTGSRAEEQPLVVVAGAMSGHHVPAAIDCGPVSFPERGRVGYPDVLRAVVEATGVTSYLTGELFGFLIASARERGAARQGGGCGRRAGRAVSRARPGSARGPRRSASPSP